ncbi:translocated actin-recruiting phosphoprotein [Chlamydia trachomatis]|nr:translocated actin-recruiting phosphoprotein [Chlamydia trachomatis]
MNIGDTNVNTTNTTPTTQSKDASTDTSDIDDINTNNQTDDINTTDKDSDGAGGVNGDISETESSSGDDSGSVSSSESDKNASVGNDGPAMKDILSAVRKHLDVVYPGENGGSTEGPLPANQTLGDVISDVENKGSAQDTKLSGNTGAGDDDPTTTAAVGNGAEEITLSDTDSGIGDDVSDTASSSGDESGGVSSPSSESNKNTAVGNDGPSGLDILAAVRKHLDILQRNQQEEVVAYKHYCLHHLQPRQLQH